MVVVIVIWTPGVIVSAPAPPEVYAPAAAVAYIPVPVHPRIAGIAIPRVVPGVVTVPPSPAVVPGRVEHCRSIGCAPGAEHRCYVAWLNPHLVARHHNIVEGGVVGSDIGVRAPVTQVEVTRRHSVRCRLEAQQTTRIGTLVVIGNKTLVCRGVVVNDNQPIGIDPLL